MTTAAQQTELEKQNVRVAYFAEFAFSTGTQRLCSWNVTFNWGGYDWLGLGQVGSISAIEESDGMEARSLNFSLNSALPSWVALAAGPVEEYRGRDAKLYQCPLDEQYRLVDTPELCWSGIMDMVTLGIDKEQGQIVLKCETSSYGLKRRPSLRVNPAQYRKKYANDPSLDYLPDLIARPQTWLSKRFQAT
jgi:hypothetical protein